MATWLVAVVPALVWFFEAPEPRFGFGELSAAAVSPLFFLVLDRGPTRAKGAVKMKWLIAGASMVGMGLVLVVSLAGPQHLGGLGGRLPPIEVFPLKEFGEVDRQEIVTPQTGDQCGRVRWCTPQPNRGIAVRRGLGWIVIEPR
jgi:hypothetical protein